MKEMQRLSNLANSFVLCSSIGSSVKFCYKAKFTSR